MDNEFRQAVATRVGYDPSAIILVDDPGYLLLETNFQVVVLAEMESHPWKWNQLDAYLPIDAIDIVENPSWAQYAGSVEVPDAMLRIERVHQTGRNLFYDRNGKLLLLYAVEDNSGYATVRGQYMCTVGMWPNLFREACINRLAGLLALSLMQRPELSAALDNRATGFFERAKIADSQQQTVQRIETNRIAARRHSNYTSFRQPRGSQNG